MVFCNLLCIKTHLLITCHKFPPRCHPTVYFYVYKFSLTYDSLSFVPDEDLYGRNIVLLQSIVIYEMLNITTNIFKFIV